MKAIIIDDDIIEAEQFKMNIDWDKLGIELAGTAENGVTGYELYQDQQPEIVITDIEMPGLSGIELAKKIRKDDTETRIIFLTSYDKFEYAHIGFQLDVSDYFLKQDLFTEDYTDRLIKVKHEYKFKNRPHIEIEENFIEEIISGGINQVPNGFEHYDELLSEYFLCFLIIEKTPIPIFQNLVNQPQPSLLTHADLRKIFGKGDPVSLIPYEYGSFLCFVKTSYMWKKGIDTKYNSNFYEQVIKKIYNLKNIKCQIILVSENGRIREIKDILEQYKHRLILRYFYDQTVIEIGMLNSLSETAVKVEEERLLSLDNDLQFDQTEDYLDSIHRVIIDNKDYNAGSSFLYAIYLHLSQCSEDILDLEKEKFWGVIENDIMWDPSTFQGIYDLLKNKYQEYYQLKTRQSMYNYTEYVKKALKIIYREYSDPDLNAEYISRNINISLPRLRAVFKEDTGKNIHQFLTELRMKKAKNLLINTSDKMDQIAAQVGYISGKYFSRMFKKETGTTPETFRLRGK